jgi:hypothetical protein
VDGARRTDGQEDVVGITIGLAEGGAYDDVVQRTWETVLYRGDARPVSQIPDLRDCVDRRSSPFTRVLHDQLECTDLNAPVGRCG